MKEKEIDALKEFLGHKVRVTFRTTYDNTYIMTGTLDSINFNDRQARIYIRYRPASENDSGRRGFSSSHLISVDVLKAESQK